MSQAKDYRRGKDGRPVDRFAGRKRRYQPLLAALGLQRAFAALPRWAQEQFWNFKFADPAVRLDPGVPAEARASIELAVAEKTTAFRDVNGNWTRVPARDFASILYPLREALQQTEPAQMTSAALMAFILRARPVVYDLYDRHLDVANGELAGAAQWAMVGHTRADARVLGLRMDFRHDAQPKPGFEVVAAGEPPQRVRATIDGDPRPAYRVGYSDCPRGIKWVSWRVRDMGLGPEEELPVYFQAHALRHLHERMDIPDAAPWMEYWLGSSLDAPVIVETQKGGDWLVEFRLNAHRCGYLVVTRADCGLVVRTFLFLTMTGTPEGDRLYKKFRLTRDEAAWLRLHRVSSFTETDLRADPDLLKILESCGCGHLWEVRGDGDHLSPKTTGFAADVRRFLRMTPAPAVAAAAA